MVGQIYVLKLAGILSRTLQRRYLLLNGTPPQRENKQLSLTCKNSKVVPKKDKITLCRSTIVYNICPVCIRKGMQGKRRLTMKEQPKMLSPIRKGLVLLCSL